MSNVQHAEVISVSILIMTMPLELNLK